MGLRDEDLVRALIDGELPPDVAGALERVLERLEKAEAVCELVRTGLSPKRQHALGPRKVRWWDVGMALKAWERVRAPEGSHRRDEPTDR